MKQRVSPPVVIGIVIVVVLIIGYFAFKTFAPPSMTGASGPNPYAGKPDMTPGRAPNGSTGVGSSSGAPMGSGGPMGSSGPGGSGGPMGSGGYGSGGPMGSSGPGSSGGPTNSGGPR